MWICVVACEYLLRNNNNNNNNSYKLRSCDFGGNGHEVKCQVRQEACVPSWNNQLNNSYSSHVTHGRIHGLNASVNEIQAEEPTKGISIL